MSRTAFIEVLGAIAYGERKAYDGAAHALANGAKTPAERRVWRTIAAEELRHHKGFVRRPEALGADPVRAIRPYIASRRVADPETAAFVDTVIADEVSHEARAAAEVGRLMATYPDGRRQAARAGRHMLVRMASSGSGSGPRQGAFLRLGRSHELDLTGPLARVDPFGVHRSAAA